MLKMIKRALGINERDLENALATLAIDAGHRINRLVQQNSDLQASNTSEMLRRRKAEDERDALKIRIEEITEGSVDAELFRFWIRSIEIAPLRVARALRYCVGAADYRGVLLDLRATMEAERSDAKLDLEAAE